MSITARILIGASLFSATIGAQTSPAAAGRGLRAADLVFRGGTVWTADAARPTATAVAVRNGRISYVGDDPGVQPFVGAATRVIDLQAGMLLPGFHDSHVHIVQGGLGLASCHLSMDATAQAVAMHIAACARDNPNTAWVTGRGWRLSAFPNASPTRGQLDAILPDRPAFFMAADGHSAWVNSRALTAAGVTASTADPQGGRIERDPLTGEPSGTLRDLAAGVMLGVIPRPSADEMEAAIVRGLALVNSFVITSVHEARAEEALLQPYLALDRRGPPTASVTVAAAAAVTLTDAAAAR